MVYREIGGKTQKLVFGNFFFQPLILSIFTTNFALVNHIDFTFSPFRTYTCTPKLIYEFILLVKCTETDISRFSCSLTIVFFVFLSPAGDNSVQNLASFRLKKKNQRS